MIASPQVYLLRSLCIVFLSFGSFTHLWAEEVVELPDVVVTEQDSDESEGEDGKGGNGKIAGVDEDDDMFNLEEGGDEEEEKNDEKRKKGGLKMCKAFSCLVKESGEVVSKSINQ